MLYKHHANPLARVVQGGSTSWDPSIANIKFSSYIRTAAWSPCSRFIAINRNESVLVLDGITLEQLHTMHPQQRGNTWEKLIFSPDGHLLTAYSYYERRLVSWDLQTGGCISDIDVSSGCSSISYSECGTMLGALFGKNTITTYNTSGIQISSHFTQQPTVMIWTHGEYLQFATIESRSITIWQVSFASNNVPTQVGPLHTPDNFPNNLPRESLAFLPALQYLAFIHEEDIFIWDTQCQKTLLQSTDVKNPKNLSFSSDGYFFICGTNGPEFHLWKQSPNGYLPHQNFISNVNEVRPVISPNRESIASFGDSIIIGSGSMLQLWHTTHSSTSPGVITQLSQHNKDFLVEFFPDQPLVATTYRLGSRVTILDVKSGNSQLVIDSDTEICGIGIIGNKIIIVGNGKIMMWELPGGDCVSSTEWNVGNCVHTTIYEHLQPIQQLYASVSSDLNHIAFGSLQSYAEALSIYNTHTGEKLADTQSHGSIPGFTLDGNEVWCATGSGAVDKWTIIKDSESKAIKLEKLWKEERPHIGFPWHSSSGYQITDDGWVLNPWKKQLLWLPHQWWSTKVKRRWSGNFFTLFCIGLQEPIILELDV